MIKKHLKALFAAFVVMVVIELINRETSYDMDFISGWMSCGAYSSVLYWKHSVSSLYSKL